MPTAIVSLTPAVLRLRQSFTSVPFTSNVVTQGDDGDTEITISVYIANPASLHLQLLFQDSNGQWDTPSAEFAHAIVYGSGRSTILPPFKVPSRSFKVALVPVGQGSEISGVIEVWGHKWKIET